MQYEVVEVSATRREVLATTASFEAAKDAVRAMGVVHMEDDADYPGCADTYLASGRVVAIQPVGFKVQS